MLPAVSRKVTMTLVALGLALSTAAPVHALGKRERNILKGLAAAAVVGAIINETRKSNADPVPQYYVDPQVQQPHWQRDRHRDRHHDRPAARSQNVAGAVFNEYDLRSRRIIQSRLASYGYYRGGIDGVWGRGTAAAMTAYARDVQAGRSLHDRNGAISLYNALLG